MISSVAGLTANCTLEPPVSTPTARITAIAWSRSSWYWRSVSVCCGATVTESPGVDAHRVDVLDRADDHDVVGVVAHDLELELAPAEHRLVDEHLADRRGGEAARDDRLVLLPRACDAAAAAAERERRADDRRQAELGQRVERLLRPSWR